MPSKEQIRKYYESNYPEDLVSSPFKVREIFSILKRRLTCTNVVVDLGCGAGGICRELNEKFQAYFIGCDISSHMLHTAKKVNPNLALVKADCEQVPLRNHSADMILLIDLLEHLPHPSKALAESARISKRWVLVRTPLEDCLYHNLKKTKEQWASEWKEHSGHLWKFNLQKVKLLLRQNGLRDVDVRISRLEMPSTRVSLSSFMVAFLTRLIPSTIYRKILPSEHLILARKTWRRRKVT